MSLFAGAKKITPQGLAPAVFINKESEPPAKPSFAGNTTAEGVSSRLPQC